MFKKKERQCVCKRCHHTWYLPVKVPRKVGKVEMAGARLQTTGQRISLGRKPAASELHRQSLEKLREDRGAYKRCPECGSASITDRIVKI